jgi:hypothetical protein
VPLPVFGPACQWRANVSIGGCHEGVHAPTSSDSVSVPTRFLRA